MKTIIVFLLTMFIAFTGIAQLTARPQGKNFGCYYGFYEYLPPHYADSAKWPVVIFLHGVGEGGGGSEEDLLKVLKWGPPRMAKEGKPFEAIIIAPQAPGGWFSTHGLGGMMEDGTFHPVLKNTCLFETIKRNYKIDTSRVYITGLSAGGKGVMQAISYYPNKFAAAVAVCPAQQTGRENQVKTPLWLFHNERDPVINAQVSYTIYNEVKKAGAYVNLTVYPALAYHDAWSQAYSDPKMWSWLFQQKKRAPLDVSGLIRTYLAQKGQIETKIDSLLNGAKVFR